MNFYNMYNTAGEENRETCDLSKTCGGFGSSTPALAAKASKDRTGKCVH